MGQQSSILASLLYQHFTGRHRFADVFPIQASLVTDSRIVSQAPFSKICQTRAWGLIGFLSRFVASHFVFEILFLFEERDFVGNCVMEFGDFHNHVLEFRLGGKALFWGFEDGSRPLRCV